MNACGCKAKTPFGRLPTDRSRVYINRLTLEESEETALATCPDCGGTGIILSSLTNEEYLAMTEEPQIHSLHLAKCLMKEYHRRTNKCLPSEGPSDQ